MLTHMCTYAKNLKIGPVYSEITGLQGTSYIPSTCQMQAGRAKQHWVLVDSVHHSTSATHTHK